MDHIDELHLDDKTYLCNTYLNAQHDAWEQRRYHEENMAKFIMAVIGLAAMIFLMGCCFFWGRWGTKRHEGAVQFQYRQNVQQHRQPAVPATAEGAAAQREERQNKR